MKLRNTAFAVSVLVSTALAGCAGIPKIGEGEKAYMTSFPHHPIVTLLHGGAIHADSMPDGVKFGYEHWIGIKGGSHLVEAGMADRGHNAWGSLLGCYSNVRWNDAGTHVMETTSYNNNLTNVIKREFFVLERMGERWEKKRLTKEEFGNIRIGQIR